MIETVAAVIVLTLIIGMSIGIMSILTNMTRKTKDFTELRVYQISKIAEIRDDLEESMVFEHEPITDVDYSETDYNLKIRADIDIYNVGTAFGKDLYMVSMSLKKTDSGASVTTQTILRGGCVADVS